MIPDIEILSKARKLLDGGNLPRAERACRQILDLDSACTPAWFLLGIVSLKAEKYDAAIQAFGECLRLRPNYPDAHNNIGICLARQSKFAEAVESFTAAIAQRSHYAEAHSNLGNALGQQGRTAEAIEHYRAAISQSPGYPGVYNNLGIALARQEKFAEAEHSYRRAIELQPTYAEAHNNLGNTLVRLKRLEEAAACFEEALRIRPTYADAHTNLGVALGEQKRWPEAVEAFRQAIQLQPRFHEAHNRLGQALAARGQLEEAAACFRDAIQFSKDFVAAHRNLGNVLFELEDLPGAIESFKQVLRLKPDCADTHCRLALALGQGRRFGQAVQHFDRAIKLRPKFYEARMHRGLSRLQTGDFERGWADYEWRWKCKEFRPRKFTQPRWEGEALDGRRILLHSEQGLGDTLQFIRYARLVKERGGTVLLRAPKPLLRLLQQCPYLDGVFPDGGELPDFDLQVPLLSLPKIFGTTLTTVPAGEPYLFANSELMERWRGELSYIRAFKVGINWQGNPKYRGDRRRSIPLAHFAPLASVPGVRLISLQKGFGTEQIPDVRFSVSELGGQFDETSGPFMDTAAVMKNLDLFITSDTALAHLAGGLGIPTWLALPHAPDWRWLLNREDCPWYPAMRLFRQTEFDNWEPVFEHMTEVVKQTLVRRDNVESSDWSIPSGRATAASLTVAGKRLADGGRLDEAIISFQQAIDLDRDFAEAQCRLGAALQSQGQLDTALSHLNEALRLQSDYPEAHHFKGIVLARKRKFPEAIESFQRALELRPGYIDSLNGWGLALLDQGKSAEAEAMLRDVIGREPDFKNAHLNLGRSLANQRKLDEAFASVQEALRIDPTNSRAHLSLGKILGDQNKLDEAIESIQRAIDLRPQDSEAHNDLGIIRSKQTKFDDAIKHYEEAIRLRPDNPVAYNNLGIAFANQGERTKAIANYRRALQIRPKYAEVYNHMAIVLTQEGKFDEAIASYEHALTLKDPYPEAHGNLAIALTEIGQPSKALEHFEKAISLRPDYPEAYMNRSLTHLVMGDFERGWADYEWRWKCKEFRPRKFTQPRWEGEALDGRRILLHSEQGLGDTLQFIRYARLVKERGGTVLLRAPKPLLRFLQQCPYLDGVFPDGGELPDFDLQVPLLSLPKIFGTTLTTVPAGEPYLFANPELVERWRGELSYIRAFKVGINWQGNPKYRGDRRRSIPLAHFAPLASVPGVRLISLQKGFGTEQIPEVRFSVSELGGQFDETSGRFMDTAAVLKNLDLCITIDSSLAHLAGGLGVPVWLPLPHAPDWRWLMQREDSPWYPATRIFRQTEFDNWEPVFERMADFIAKLAGSAQSTLNVSMSVGDFCDYWTTRRIRRRYGAYDDAALIDELQQLEGLGRVLLEDPESKLLVKELEQTQDLLARLQPHFDRPVASESIDSSWIDAVREFYREEGHRRSLIDQLNGLPRSTLNGH